MKRLICLAIAAFLLLLPAGALAVPANSGPITQIQPDGTEISVRLYGDEKSSVYTDMDGNVVLMDTESVWKYVLKSGETFLLGGVVQPGTAPVPEGDASYVLMSDLAEDAGQARMTALKKTLITTSAGGGHSQETGGGSSTWVIIACVAGVAVIAAVVIIVIRRKRGA